MNRTINKFGIPAYLSAFGNRTIGSKVTDHEQFFAILEAAIHDYEPKENEVEGQMFVHLPQEAYDTVSTGEGLREGTDPEEDYVTRGHRGRADAYLKRQFAAKCIFLAVGVYTAEAFYKDPDVKKMGLAPKDFEKCGEGRLNDLAPAWYITCVIASGGPEAPLSPRRFVANLAGGNNAYSYDALTSSMGGAVTGLMRVMDEAEKIQEHDDIWATIADE